jgi:hypothetical protein
MKLIHLWFATYSSRHKTDMGGSEQFLRLDAIRKHGHSGIFFKSLKVQNFLFQQGFPGELNGPHLSPHQ